MIRLLLLALLPSTASAQSFVQPIDHISAETTTVAVMADGTEVAGSVRSHMLMNGYGLFGDCAPLMEMVGGDKPRIDDMALHVWVYDRECR